MFKTAFCTEMSQIAPSDKTKERVTQEMKEYNNSTNNSSSPKQTPPPKTPHKKLLIAAVASLLVVTMVGVTIIGANFLDNFIYNDSQSNMDTMFAFSNNGQPKKLSANNIYTYFNDIYKSQSINNGDLGSIEPSDDIAVEDEMAYEEFEDRGEDSGIGSTGTDDYSDTNIQVEGVDEADIVKTDGKYIYTLQKNKAKIQVVRAKGGQLELVSVIELEKECSLNDMYLQNDRLIVISCKYTEDYSDVTTATIYNVANPSSPEVLKVSSQSGFYRSSRLTDGALYLFSEEHFYGKPNKKDPHTYLPITIDNGTEACPVENIYGISGITERRFLTISSLNINSGERIDQKAILGGGETIYANTKKIFVAEYCYRHYDYVNHMDEEDWNDTLSDTTRILSFDINKGKISPKAEGFVKGNLLNQFSLDEYKGHLRVVVTSNGIFSPQSNALYTLDENLKIKGQVTDLAKNERVYSVRFMENVCYFVTFRTTDPLFAVDLSDPASPKVLSELKIPGFSNYLHPFDDGLLLGIGSDADEATGVVEYIKLSMFDISDPKNVTEKHTIVTEDADHSLGTQHKAILVSKSKNLIGYGASGCYHVYGYDAQKGFFQKARFIVPSPDAYTIINQDIRGIYIGDYFYVCSQRNITSYTLDDFVELSTLNY